MDANAVEKKIFFCIWKKFQIFFTRETLFHFLEIQINAKTLIKIER